MIKPIHQRWFALYAIIGVKLICIGLSNPVEATGS